MADVADPLIVSRRAFLARIGVLGAAVGSGLLAAPDPAAAPPAGPTPADLRPVLDDLRRDTFGGLAAFVLPGRDRYSRAQGTRRREPGAVAAETPAYLVEALDRVVPFPDALARPVAAAFDAALSDPAGELPERLVGLPAHAVRRVDAALAEVLAGPDGVPLSLAVALLLNLISTQVHPAAVDGPFRSPFARLPFADKARVFALVEGPEADLAAALDARLPDPLREALFAVLRTFGAPLLELPALGAFSEWARFDPEARRLAGTPVGWALSGYSGVADGRDELRGYYQERTEVSD